MDSRWLASLFLLAALPGEIAASSPAWPTARHDLQRTARSPVLASQSDSLRYEPRTSGSSAVPSAAVERPHAIVSFSNGGQLRAVDPVTGATVWSVAASGGRKFGAPAAGPAGVLYAAQAGANLPGLVVALDPDGSERWTYQTLEVAAYFSDLAVDPSGRIVGRYLEGQQTRWHLLALSESGTLLWKTSVPYASEFDPTPPAILQDGDIVISATDAASNDRLMRIDAATGSIEWSIVPGRPLSGPLVADNGLVVVHTPGFPPDNGVRAFHPATGAQVWSVPYFYAEYGEDNPPALLPGGEIVAIANGDAQGNRLIYRISPDGALLGTAPYPSTGYYVKSISGGDGSMYVWTSMRLLAFRPVTGEVMFEYFPAPFSSCLRTSQATILSDGSIFASWQRKQTCDSPSAFGEYVTFAPPASAASAGEAGTPPADRRVRGVSPNPSTGPVAVLLDLPRRERISLCVFDARGSLVRLLLDGEAPAGERAVRWDGQNAGGRPSPAGVYWIRLSGEKWAERARLVRIRGGE